MKRIMLVVAYDGTAYHGWQRQPNGETIEGVLNRCLSELLREEIEVIGASRTDSGVHALCNVAVFEYRIYNAAFPMPTERLYAHFSYVSYDVERMREAAAYFVGTHDFKSFCSVDTHVENTVRMIEHMEVDKKGSLIVIRVTGRGFLYNMVRIMAGTLMEVGRGNLEPQDIERILEAKDRSAAGPTAPACGLTLTAYEFIV